MVAVVASWRFQYRAADQEVAGTARRHGLPRLVHEPEIVAGDGAAGRPRGALARPVGEEDVADLGRADAVQDLRAGALQPALEQGGW
jgi:hypothetical protein